MIIGFDVSQTGALRAGCGYFADSLIRAFAEQTPQNKFVLYPTFGNFYFDAHWDRTTFAPRRPNFARGLAHRDFDDLDEFWQSPPPDLDELLGFPDVVHANNFFCPKGLQHARLIYTLYDLSFLRNPEWTTEANRQGCFEGVFRASLHADRVMAISQFTKRHFLETFPHFPEERIDVVPLASRFTDQRRVNRPPQLGKLRPDQFWLCVGTLEPRKNHACLLRAFARLKAHLGQTYPLVLAGGKGWLLDNLNRLIGDLGLTSDVIMAGYLEDTSLQWLYQNCYAAVYPSLFEGFGLPVLEAMSLGAPVITSNLTSIPEVAGDAALLIDPHREEAIAEAMLQLTQQPQLRGQLREKGAIQARRFRWVDSAQAALACYEKAVLAPRLSEVLAQSSQTSAASRKPAPYFVPHPKQKGVLEIRG